MKSRHHRRSAIVTIASIALIGLAGCGAPGPIKATVKDYAVQLDRTTTKSGKVSFSIKNSGSIVHEFVIIQTDLAVDKLPIKADGTGIDEEKLESPGEEGDLDIGKSADLNIDLKPGRYLLICNLPNHFKLGMHTEFTVTE